MSTTSKAYTVLVFADYRKEVEIDVLKVFSQQVDAINFAEQMVKDAKEKRLAEYGSDDEEEGEGNGEKTVEGSEYQTEYVQLHGKMVFSRELATYRGFFGPVLAVVEVDME